MDPVKEEFKQLIPEMLTLMMRSLQQGEETIVQEGLKAFVDVLEEHPKFLVDHMTDTVKLVTEIANATSLEEETRIIAMEIALTVAEKFPVELRKSHALKDSILLCAINMIATTDLNLDEESIKKGDVDGEVGSMGQEALDRLMRALGAKAVLPYAFSSVERFLMPSSAWELKRAGLNIIGVLSQSGGKTFFEKMQSICELVIPFVSAQEHPLVRLCATQMLGRLCYSFRDLDEEVIYACAEGEDVGEEDAVVKDKEDAQSESFQRRFSEPVVKALIGVLRSGDEWKIKEEAALATVAFCSGCTDPSLLKPYDSQLLESLFMVIKSGPMTVKVEGLTAVSAIANVIGQDFGKYYDHFMPLAKSLVAADPASFGDAEDSLTLRGKAMDCVALMGNAVSVDKFKPDANEVMDLLIHQHAALMSAQDDQDPISREYIIRACARICTKIGDPFLPYLENIIPSLIQSAAQEIEISIVDAPPTANGDTEESAPGMHMIDMHIRGVGEKRLGFNTWVAQEKQLACHMLYAYADGFGKSFHKWIIPVANVLLPELVSPVYSVRIAATCAVPCLLKSLSDALFEMDQSAANYALAQNLFEQTLLKLIEAIQSDEEDEDADIDEADDEGDAEMVLVAAEGLASILRCAFESGGRSDADVDKMLAPGYNPENLKPRFGIQLKNAEEIMGQLIGLMRGRIEKRFVARKNIESLGDKIDAQLMEDFEAAEEKTNEFMDSLSEAMGCIIKAHNADIIQPFARHCIPFADLLIQTPAVSAPLKSVALFFYDDVLEYASPQAQRFLDKGVTCMLEFAQHENRMLRQAACYGLGVAAQFGGEAFSSYVEPAAQKLLAVVEAPGARKGQNASPTDNAISSLFKICVDRLQPADAKALMQKLLSFMPLYADKLEAKIVHYFLMRQIKSNDPRFNELMPRMREVLVLAAKSQKGLDPATNEYDEGTSIITKETRQFAATLV